MIFVNRTKLNRFKQDERHIEILAYNVLAEINRVKYIPNYRHLVYSGVRGGGVTFIHKGCAEYEFTFPEELLLSQSFLDVHLKFLKKDTRGKELRVAEEGEYRRLKAIFEPEGGF